MVSKDENAVIEIIHRIRTIEDEVRKSGSYEAAHVAMRCKWVAQDVLEERYFDSGSPA